MKFKVWTAVPYDECSFSKARIEQLPGSKAYFKPRGGVWACQGNEWYDWCQTENYATEKLNYGNIIEFNGSVLKIDSVEDINNLDSKYKMFDKPIDFEEVWENRFPLNLEAIKNDYDALWIGEPMSFVLHAFDVPSICIFDPEKVNFVKVVEQRHFPDFDHERR